MEISDKLSPDAKSRDYKYHREAFIDLVAKLAHKFAEKESSKTNSEGSSASTIAKEEEDIRLILDKHIIFIPELTMANISLLITMFGLTGLSEINQNYLALLRYFHKLKYKWIFTFEWDKWI